MKAVSLPGPSRSRALLGLIAALLVHGVWLLLLQWERQRGTPAAAATRLELRILPSASLTPEPRLARPTARSVSRINTSALVLPAPETSTAAPGATAALETAAATPAATTSHMPLRLSLPPERPASGPRAASMLSQMLNDPRSHSVKRTLEWAVADAAGSLPIDVQSSTDGTNAKLIRQGSKCIRVAEARIKTLNPMDENAKGTPAVAGPCVTN